MKTCTRCSEEKPLSKFQTRKASKDGLNSRCSECVSETNRIWRSKNPEKVKIMSALYRKNNLDKVNQSISKWRAANPDKVRRSRNKSSKLHADKIKISKDLYRKTHLEKFAARSAKRRASKLQRTPHWLTQEDLQIIEEFYQVVKMLTETTGIPYEVDHIVPLQGKNVSGLHVPNNLQVLTKHDNCSKSNLFEV